MKLRLKDELPVVSVSVVYQGASVEIPDMLVDTGSGTTILAADLVASIGIAPLPEDILHTIRGVGGMEVVFRRSLDYVQLGECRLPHFPVDIGGMDYGFAINGILGMDVLTAAGALINLQTMIIEFPGQRI